MPPYLKAPHKPRKCPQGPITSHHVEGQDEAPLRWFGRIDRPFVGPTSPLLGQVVDMCALGYILGVYRFLSRFGRRVGRPSIHVMLTWQHVTRRGCFIWIDDVMGPGEYYVAASHWLGT
jgi:hypothetical protein